MSVIGYGRSVVVPTPGVKVVQDKDDFIAEEGIQFFNDWFSTVSGYDVEFQDVAQALDAMETLKTTFDAVRAKLQVVRLR